MSQLKQGLARPLQAAKATARGSREVNQDRCLFLSSPDTTVLCVADGLGGHPRGEVAAQLMIDVVEARFRQCTKPLGDPDRFMLQCIGKAHDSILRFGRRQRPVIAPRTTSVIAIIQHGTAYWAHVGDSRLYLVRNGQVKAQTRDHSQVRFVRQSAEETPRACASLTRCLGGLPEPPTTTCGVPVPLQKNDGLLLCTDGLWNHVPSKELVGIFAADANLGSGLARVTERAAGEPGSDNVTAVAVRWLSDAANWAATRSKADSDTDPALEQAIEHLEQVLEKNG
jgi:serine/threonine protein phosphatase PrpC